MRKTIFFFSLFFLALTATAQTPADALRYAQTAVTGTARTAGIGGGIGALGADFSVLSTNPAGLASYRRSEFVLTPGFFGSDIEATLQSDAVSNPLMTQNDSKFLLNNIGVVVTSQPIASKWKTFNIGIGLNQLVNFNRQLSFDGRSVGTIVDRFEEQANGSGFSDFESGLAFDAFALYDADGDGFFESDFTGFPDALIQKEQIVLEEGSINELVFSIAGNYNEKLMVGATLGLPFLSFTQNKTYQEIDPFSDANPDGDIPFFDELTYIEDLRTTGVGINLKLGLIYRLSQAVRLGAAVHTPTAYNLEDNFTTSFRYVYLDNDEDGNPVVNDNTANSPDGLFDYKYNTPWRFIGSAGFIFGKNGFVSADVEYVNFGGSSFNLTSDSDNPEDAAFEEELNGQITDQFQSALNVRVGGELALSIFRLRAGLGLLGAPEAFGDTDFLYNYSLGAGFRFQNFFLDGAYTLQQADNTYVPYFTTDAPQQAVSTTTYDSRVLLTLGFKF